MNQEAEPDLIFEVTKTDAPDNFKMYWDTYFVFLAKTHYKEVTYQAWGTDAEEAKTKVRSLIASDKINGVIRAPGSVVE